MDRAIWISAALQVLAAVSLHAQPWVPPRGEGTVTVTYQNYYVTGHFDVHGNRNKNGATHSKTLITELDVGVTDTIGLTISVPFVAVKYTGPPVYYVGGIPTYPGPLDDRTYHGTFQDLRFEGRKMWWRGPAAIAPFVGVTIPTHNYETHGEAVAGKHRQELLAGAGAGADLGHLIPRTAIYGRYALAIARPEHGFESIRSIVDVDAEHGLTDRIGIRGLAAWQFAHNAPTIPELAAGDWVGHDRFVVSSYVDAGGGLMLSLSRSTDLHALWIATLSGKSGAHIARTFAIGATVSFGEGNSSVPLFDSAQKPRVKTPRSRSWPQAAGFGR